MEEDLPQTLLLWFYVCFKLKGRVNTTHHYCVEDMFLQGLHLKLRREGKTSRTHPRLGWGRGHLGEGRLNDREFETLVYSRGDESGRGNIVQEGK